jgi:hypothetical protein
MTVSTFHRIHQKRAGKKCRPAAYEDVEVVQIDDDSDDDDFDEDELPNTCNLLPNTCDFTPAANKKDNTSDESSDGGETVLESQEQDLLLSSDS